MEAFFKVKTPEEVHRIIKQFGPHQQETVPLELSLDRVLSQEIQSGENLPHFFRSVVDGYAVRSKDTFGASETLPGLLEIVGEVLMGQQAEKIIGPGQTVKISTGGMIPEKADSVVMVEHCHLLDEQTLEISRAISPLENTIQPGDDFSINETVLKKGHAMRPQDMGVLAGLGISHVSAYLKPKIAIVSTGDEIISVNETPEPGQVRDINQYTLSAFCRRLGAEPVTLARCTDNFDALKQQVEEGLRQADGVWISGGSSVGTRDMTLKVFETLENFELLVHGISVSPGKPTIIGKCGSKPLIGLPGHVTSALVVAEVFLTPLIGHLSGRSNAFKGMKYHVTATLDRNVESAPGREDYIRVKLIEQGEQWLAAPIFGKSGLISTLVEADGLIRIPMNTEGLYKDDTVQVLLGGGIR